MLHFREGQRLHHQQRLPPEPDERDGAGAVRRSGGPLLRHDGGGIPGAGKAGEIPEGRGGDRHGEKAGGFAGFDGSGAMATGWRKVGGFLVLSESQRRRRRAQGWMLTGLREINGKRYFFNPGGSHGVLEGALIVTNEDGAVKV